MYVLLFKKLDMSLMSYHGRVLRHMMPYLLKALQLSLVSICLGSFWVRAEGRGVNILHLCVHRRVDWCNDAKILSGQWSSHDCVSVMLFTGLLSGRHDARRVYSVHDEARGERRKLMVKECIQFPLIIAGHGTSWL